MVFCSRCGNKIRSKDRFCAQCGTKHSTNANNQDSKASGSQKYVAPAVASFFIPGLGQVLKQQVKWAGVIWLWLILGNGLLSALAGILGPFTFILMVGYSLTLWVYQLYDAYNAPEDEKIIT